MADGSIIGTAANQGGLNGGFYGKVLIWNGITPTQLADDHHDVVVFQNGEYAYFTPKSFEQPVDSYLNGQLAPFWVTGVANVLLGDGVELRVLAGQDNYDPFVSLGGLIRPTPAANPSSDPFSHSYNGLSNRGEMISTGGMLWQNGKRIAATELLGFDSDYTYAWLDVVNSRGVIFGEGYKGPVKDSHGNGTDYYGFLFLPVDMKWEASRDLRTWKITKWSLLLMPMTILLLASGC